MHGTNSRWDVPTVSRCQPGAEGSGGEEPLIPNSVSCVRLLSLSDSSMCSCCFSGHLLGLFFFVLFYVLVTRAHINVQSYPERSTGNGRAPVRTKWLIGLVFNEQAGQHLSIDLTLQRFSDIVHSVAGRCQIFREGMSTSARYMSQKDFSWDLPQEPGRRVISQEPQPSVSTAAPSLTSHQATKRSRSPHSETASKKFKSDEGTSVEVSLSQSKSGGLKRARTPESESRSKRVRTDQLRPAET
ncbi:poly(A) polymerase alpha-B-like [Notothenia coriiceps]|uniref:Poly(A) polymerase alpha-B-like n=1 Tax=Notothenia coriiceps TaxID=8208 RepID=A0A6I9NM57_9TELE|nr:PREDICTED: poly(A) polymerase alpha-B-like [Notothenia coriiceps]